MYDLHGSKIVPGLSCLCFYGNCLREPAVHVMMGTNPDLCATVVSSRPHGGVSSECKRFNNE